MSKSPREITNVFNLSTLGREDLFYNKPLPYPQQVALDNLDLGLNQTYYDNGSTLPVATKTIQQAFQYNTVNNPIFSQTNTVCYSYLKEYKNNDFLTQVGIFTNRNFTSVERVKSLIKGFRFYYEIENGGGGAVDYLTSNFGEEQTLINSYYDNAATTTYPYQFVTLNYNGPGVSPNYNGAQAWLASYLKLRTSGYTFLVTLQLDTNTQTILMSWILNDARYDFNYYVNDIEVTSNRFAWEPSGDTRIFPIAASNTYVYGTNQPALNGGASNTPPSKQDLLNMKFTNIATTPKQYDITQMKDLWNQANAGNANVNWAKETITKKFSITKIEMIPYNN